MLVLAVQRRTIFGNKSHLRWIVIAASLYVWIGACHLAEEATTSREKSVGDTIFVSTSAPGKWGPARLLHGERVPDTSIQASFGRIQALAATPDGGVVVLDAKSSAGLALLQFDSSGMYVRTIGRKGNGPGEYMYPFAEVFVAADGVIWLNERSRDLLMRFGADGQFLGSFVVPFRSASNALVPSNVGGVFIYASALWSDSLAYASPMIHLDSTGAVIDSLPTRPREWIDRSVPRLRGTILPDGRAVATRPDRVGFLVWGTREHTTPIVAQIDAVPPMYLPLERDEKVRLLGGSQVELDPVYKDLVIGAETDLDGRVWIRRSAPGQRVSPRVKFYGGPDGDVMEEWAEPLRFAAFEQDGTYLGEVSFPLQTTIVSFAGKTAWGVEIGTSGESILVRYRLFD